MRSAVRDLKRTVQASAPATLLGALEDLLAEVEQVEMESWAAGGLVDRVAAKVTTLFLLLLILICERSLAKMCLPVASAPPPGIQ